MFHFFCFVAGERLYDYVNSLYECNRVSDNRNFLSDLELFALPSSKVSPLAEEFGFLGRVRSSPV